MMLVKTTKAPAGDEAAANKEEAAAGAAWRHVVAVVAVRLREVEVVFVEDRDGQRALELERVLVVLLVAVVEVVGGWKE